MNKNLLIAGVIVVLVGGLVVVSKKSPTQKQLTNLKQVEKKLAKDLGLKEGKPNIPLYKGAKVDEEKCGKDAFFVEEKSTEFIPNYCKFLKSYGWKLEHPDYSECDQLTGSYAGGFNYQKGTEKIAVSVVRYGDATCFGCLKDKDCLPRRQSLEESVLLKNIPNIEGIPSHQ